MKVLSVIKKMLIGFFLVVLVSVIIAFPIMWLWNWLMPVIFGLVEINVWQALGLSLLSSVLFKTYTTSK